MNVKRASGESWQGRTLRAWIAWHWLNRYGCLPALGLRRFEPLQRAGLGAGGVGDAHGRRAGRQLQAQASAHHRVGGREFERDVGAVLGGRIGDGQRARVEVQRAARGGGQAQARDTRQLPGREIDIQVQVDMGDPALLEVGV
ncbi:MAG: hypothetical protein IPG61_18385 [bacterium]|nr:hypothetical protein [bacterium]